MTQMNTEDKLFTQLKRSTFVEAYGAWQARLGRWSAWEAIEELGWTQSEFATELMRRMDLNIFPYD